MVAIFYKWFLLSSLWTLAGSAKTEQNPPSRHPFYIAVTEINLNPSDKTLEISCKMFAEDLEQILEKDFKTQLDMSSDKDKSKFDSYIQSYVNGHLSVVVDGKPVSLSYIGFEKEKESAYCYFQVEKVSSVKKLDITNSLLQDFTTEQINIIHATVNGKRQSTKLDYPDKSASFSF